ncbi:class I SAM-dependent methyltransferase [Desulfofustis limnaeus]|uniref:Methyltransferase type 11 domain-containing protein n=1 Tax=Desulfofustis limnaeus TaxID=2740163 RepID=A0ABM7W9F1_9BACT|nr:class I SAM-dependent methyltransferase [Desulfofustis limnaeus]BDD87612.1 hypothetical protein DPPLL_19770 [Desulfofustis limnaeus]
MKKYSASEAENTLQLSRIHEEWTTNYRTRDNDLFYRCAFKRIFRIFKAPKGYTIVDAGCGSCYKSKIIVDFGYRVLGIDISASALSMARDSINGTEYENHIDLQQHNLTDIKLSDKSIDYLISWGVLMHIPQIDKAIAEMCRIVKNGGYIAVSESNMYSLQAITIRMLKRLLKKEKAEIKNTSAGLEFWEKTDEGDLMTRQTNAKWLVLEFEKHGMKLVNRNAGQFTELYWLVNTKFIKKIIHIFNNIWFEFIKIPSPAFGNIFIFKKIN